MLWAATSEEVVETASRSASMGHWQSASRKAESTRRLRPAPKAVGEEVAVVVAAVGEEVAVVVAAGDDEKPPKSPAKEVIMPGDEDVTMTDCCERGRGRGEAGEV